MKVFNHVIGNNYIAGFLAAGYLLIGIETANLPLYDNVKPEQTSIMEFKAGKVEKKRTAEGMPEHKFPVRGIFFGGKKTPYITYIYENKEKMEMHEPARTFTSTMDNGINDLKITNEKGCQRCHPKRQIIPYLNEYKDKISM